MILKIGNVKIRNPLVLAPMAQVTDIGFRILCKKFGAGLICTEMISADAIFRKNKLAIKKAQVCKEEKPVSVQIFGAKEKEMITATKFIESQGADILDINAGCPDLKVIKQGAGSALLKNPEKIANLVSKIIKNVNIPVTVKIRLGIKSDTSLKTAKAVEKAGASAIAIHARTSEQRYSGKADWNAIKKIKQELSIPVIGNGDIFKGEDAKNMLEETKCDFAMIGRGAIGNPHIFKEALDAINGKKIKAISDSEKLRLYFDYLSLTKKFNSFHTATAKMHASSFTKGIRYSAELRNKISKAKELEEIIDIISEFRKEIRL